MSYPRDRFEMKRYGYWKKSEVACTKCHVVVELWMSTHDKELVYELPKTGNPSEKAILHRCKPGRPEQLRHETFQAKNRARGVHQLFQTSQARIVIAIFDDGVAHEYRHDIPAEDLRNEIISAANLVRNHKQGAIR